jgi:hypothetical protein
MLRLRLRALAANMAFIAFGLGSGLREASLSQPFGGRRVLQPDGDAKEDLLPLPVAL